MNDISELAETYEMLEACCLHEPQWRMEDVDTFLCGVWGDSYSGWADTPKQGSDCSSVWVTRLKDGTYGLLCESEDYTGHGCMCNSYTVRCQTLSGLLTHLSDEERHAVVYRLLRDADPGFKILEKAAA